MSSGCDGTLGSGQPPDDPVPDAAPVDEPDAAAVLIDAPTVIPVPCEGGDRVSDPVTGNCYIHVNDIVTWDAAVQGCVDLGGHLVTITSDREQQIVFGLGDGLGIGLVDVWLGADDRSVENTFQWINNDDFTVFDNFRINEPNNGEPNSLDGEDCVIMEVDVGGTWDDRNCDEGIGKVFTYFCEQEP